MAGIVVRSYSYAGQSDYDYLSQSVLESTKRRTAYSAMPTRYPLPTSRYYDTRSEDYLLSDRVSNASFLSNYALDEGYDTAKRSRGRDAQLLRDATHAIRANSEVRSTTASPAAALFSTRRYPRRFGKPSVRKNKSSSFYAARIPRQTRSASVSDLRASSVTPPSNDWRNLARARSVSVARSLYEDNDVDDRASLLRSRRAQSVDPTSFRPVSRASLGKSSLPPPYPLPYLRRPFRSPILTPPVYPGYYDPFYVEYEPDLKRVARRKPRVVAVPRRGPGNYYERLMRRRGRLPRRSSYDVVPYGDDYTGASLVFNVQGTGLSPEGRPVDFAYTPPPIPLFGRTLGVDERLIRSGSIMQPVDTFLSGHLTRMGALRDALNYGLERDRLRRLKLSQEMPDLERRTMIIPAGPALYSRRPGQPVGWPRMQRLPVTSYRSRLDDGLTQRLDVISLGDINPRVASRALLLPASTDVSLSMLDKINIKVTSESFATPQASVAARRVARGQSMVPRAASAPPRPLSVEVDPWAVQDRYQIDPYYDYTTSATIPDFYDYPQPVRARRPMVVYARQGPVVLDRAHSVPPALYYQEREKRQRMQSLPPSLPVPPVPLRVWPGFRRATSVPFDVVVPPVRSRRPYPVYERGVSIDVEPVRRGRLYPVYERRRSYVGLPYQAVQSVPLLPSLGLSAHKMPRRYLSRYPVRTVFGGFQGYYNPMSWVRRRPEDNAGKSGMRPRVLASPLARASLGRAWGRVLHSSDPFRATLVPAQETVYGFPDLLFYPRVGRKPSNRAKAAIIASKMEPDPIKRRRPRSEYAAKKYRALNMDAKEGVFTKVPRSSGLYASNPPLPKPSDRKAIRTEDGYAKPKNVLSWQYRLESKMTPGDLLYQPSSFSRIRERVREAQDGMDRHRQMLDRYMPEEGADTKDAAAKVLRKMAEMEKRDTMVSGDVEPRRSTVKVPDYYACGVDPSNPPMSDLRRRIRRTLNKTRRSSVF